MKFYPKVEIDAPMFQPGFKSTEFSPKDAPDVLAWNFSTGKEMAEVEWTYAGGKAASGPVEWTYEPGGDMEFGTGSSFLGDDFF